LTGEQRNQNTTATRAIIATQNKDLMKKEYSIIQYKWKRATDKQIETKTILLSKHEAISQRQPTECWTSCNQQAGQVRGATRGSWMSIGSEESHLLDRSSATLNVDRAAN
jgi:hypothetical protein